MEENPQSDDSSMKAFSNRTDLMPPAKMKSRVSSFESVTKYLESKCANFSVDDIDDMDNWSMKSVNSSYSENDISNINNKKVNFSIGEPTFLNDNKDNQNVLVTRNKYNILQWLSMSSYSSINPVNVDKQHDGAPPNLLKHDKKQAVLRDINTCAPTCY